MQPIRFRIFMLIPVVRHKLVIRCEATRRPRYIEVLYIFELYSNK